MFHSDISWHLGQRYLIPYRLEEANIIVPEEGRKADGDKEASNKIPLVLNLTSCQGNPGPASTSFPQTYFGSTASRRFSIITYRKKEKNFDRNHEYAMVLFQHLLPFLCSFQEWK